MDAELGMRPGKRTTTCGPSKYATLSGIEDDPLEIRRFDAQAILESVELEGERGPWLAMEF